MNETHPYNDYSSIPQGTRLLIIGTAPPPRFSKPRQKESERTPDVDVDFYYGSKDNLLWNEIFPKLYPELFQSGHTVTPDTRRLFLRCHGIWMHDICEEYTRKKEGSALDSDLIDLKRADLRRIFEMHQTINSLIFTGTKAEQLSGQQMERQNLIRPSVFWASGRPEMPRTRSLALALSEGERLIHTFTLPSPSPRNLPQYSLAEMVDLYRTAISNQFPLV